MQWTPDQASLSQLVSVFENSLSSDNAVQQQAAAALAQVDGLPEVNRYLLYMLVNNNTNISTNIRSVAGVKLKNNIASRFSSIDADTITYIKLEIVSGLNDADNLVRSVIGNVITSLFTQLKVDGWPDILPQLMSLVESSNPLVQVSAMGALRKICEDSARSLNAEYQGQRPLDYMIPKFLEFMGSSSQKVRAGSIFCINKFAEIKSQSFLPHVDAFLNNLFNLTTDDFTDTKLNICIALTKILDTSADKLLVHLEGILNYIIHCMNDSDESVSTEACEFVLKLAEDSDAVPDQVIRGYLPKIVPTLLRTMVYSENDQIMLASLAEDDQDVEDRPEDIRPQFAKGKEHVTVNKSSSGDKQSNVENDDDDDDDDEDLDDSMSEWNLRKCSAAALDTFSLRLPEDVLQLSMPYLRNASVSDEWYIREAAILAFGAISRGCYDYISPHLPELIPFVVQKLNDPEFSVRQISCWTLSRYSSWVAYMSYENQTQFFQPVLQGLLDRCLDKNKKVQESACSACSTFTEEAGELLAPYVETIVTQYTTALTRYRAKNRLHLYDSIQTLFSHIPESSATPQVANIIVPTLYELWQATGDDDIALWQLMECLSCVTAVIGIYMIQQAPGLYTRAIKIVSDAIVMDQNLVYDSTLEVPSKEFQITAIDLIGGLVQGLRENITELTLQAQPPLAEILMACFEDESFDVRQSALAVLGDLAINGIKVIEPYMDTVIKGTCSQIDLAYTPGVCNNAIWALGEIALKIQENIKPYAPELFKNFWKVIDDDESGTSSVLENACAAVGRLGQGAPEVLAPEVGHIINKWSHFISNMPENAEKDSAYLGMCKVVSQNPSGISDEDVLKAFIHVIACYWEPSPQLALAIRQVLQGYQSMIPNWKNFVDSLPEESRSRIREVYEL